MNSVLHAPHNTGRCRFEIRLCRSVLGWGLAIVVWCASSALGNPPQDLSIYSQLVDFESPLPVAEQALYPIAEEAYHVTDDECVPPVQRNVMVRWWNNRFSPRTQDTHSGCLDCFAHMPFGTSFRSHKMVQISKGWAARAVLYHYDFYQEDMMLNPSGERRLRELAAQFSCWSRYPLVIEATSDRPELALARRNHVVQLLHEHGVPARVEVGVPTGFMPTGEEALLMNQNLLRQVGGGDGAVGGAAGMAGGVGAAPADGGAP